MGKTIGIIVGVIVLCAAVGAGAFYGGTLYERQQATSVRNAFFNGRGANGGGGAGGAGGGGGGGFGGGVFGTVKSITGNTLQISTPQNVTTVNLSDATIVMKTITGTVSDIAVGDSITVRGQADASGAVAATSIQLLPAGTTFGNRGPRGADATATP
ncbi:MAG TPA: DUF5666 domain-containing protein [Acetobacteraceae bacterium]